MKVAILSAGNTGLAAALHLQSLGYDPMVYTRDEAKLAALRDGSIVSAGSMEGIWNIDASNELDEVLSNADFIVICTWANAHNDIFERIRDWAHTHVDPIRIIIFNGNWGAYEAFQTFSDGQAIQPSRLTIAETAGMPYMAELSFDGKSPDNGISLEIKGIKTSIEVSYAIDHDDANILRKFLHRAYREIHHCDTVFTSSLMAPNPIIHAPLCLLNMTKIEMGSDYRILSEGFTERMENLVRHIDDERHALADALGSSYTPIVKQLNSFWGSDYGTLLQLFQSNSVYSTLHGPKDVRHRFIQEDLPYGIKPIVDLGRLLNVPVTACSALLTLYEDYLGRPFNGPIFNKSIVDKLRQPSANLS